MINHEQKKIILWLRTLLAFKAATDVSRWIAVHYGQAAKFHYVGGYPKSGTTWISQLIAHYLDLRYSLTGINVPTEPGILIHHHWDYADEYAKSIYVIRDGRDVMVSLYVNTIKAFINS